MKKSQTLLNFNNKPQLILPCQENLDMDQIPVYQREEELIWETISLLEHQASVL